MEPVAVFVGDGCRRGWRKSEVHAPSTISQSEIVAGYADDDHALAAGLVDAIVGFVVAK